MEVWISPALSCLWDEGAEGRPRLGPCTQRPHPGSSCPVSSSNVSSPSCPRETTVREPGEVQQHQLSSGGGRGPSLSQRSPESWGCHSSPELTPACHADEAFSRISHPSCYFALQHGGGWAHPHRAVFLELVSSVGPHEPMPAGEGWAGPVGP